ncbi:MAG: hypothetical protein FWC39_00650 [Bacteroidetes bacterium]|nr:hypothetical protein [Bacteroidota bacterium]
METVLIQVNNSLAFNFFQNLEDLNVIKILQKTPKVQLGTIVKTKKENTLRTKRLEKIKTITKNINVDLTNYRFNREEANNYDE